jgi:hypothetical protein
VALQAKQLLESAGHHPALAVEEEERHDADQRRQCGGQRREDAEQPAAAELEAGQQKGERHADEQRRDHRTQRR